VKKPSRKFKIVRANTEMAGAVTGFVVYYRLQDYVDELRQQARWNAEKCKQTS
jgi:hypothetical protein